MARLSRSITFLLLIVASILPAGVYANTLSLNDTLGFVKKNNISNHPVWRALIHFEDHVLTSGSTIRDPNFFLSSDGSNDVRSELEETLKSFFNNPLSQCRFPARKLWLQHVIPNLELPNISCEAYSEYIHAFASDSVSVIYASGYLGNPASMYGHVLLKFNGDGTNNDLLNNTFSYGAKSDDGDNKLTYIFKGVTGGYQGRFANQKFHQQALRYNESELRDLWEYKLNLTHYQIELLLAHLWELERTDITYYFFRENCAYQLAKLLNVVIDEPLLPSGKTWVIPFDIVMMLNRDETKKYVSDVIYHGSRQEDLYEHFRQLSADEKKRVKDIVEQPSDMTVKTLRQSDPDSEKRVIDTLYDYFAFLSVKNSELTEEQKIKRQLILTERFILSPGLSDWDQTVKTPPHSGQYSTLFQVSPFYNDAMGSGVALRFRASYYDLLNVNDARIPFSELSSFDLSVYKTREHDLEIRSFTLLNVTNLNVSQTSLPQDHSPAWSLVLGYKPENLSCTDCAAPYVGGFYGESLGFNDNSAMYLSLAEQIQFPSSSDVLLEAGPEIGGVFNITPNWATVIKTGRRFNLNDVAEHRDYLSWEQRFLHHQDFDVRTSVNFDGDNYEYAINLSTYW